MADTPFKKPTTGKPGDPNSPAAGSQEKKKRRGTVSEYKKSLQEKQMLKEIYGISEKQCKRYVQETLEKMGRVENVSDELVKALEKRLDNVVFRMGFAKSRPHARQLVSHAYFLVNGKPVNIASFKVGKGDVITIKETKKKKMVFENLMENLKKAQAHVWLKVDSSKFTAQVAGEPSLAEVNPPFEISQVFEFYSR